MQKDTLLLKDINSNFGLTDFVKYLVSLVLLCLFFAPSIAQETGLVEVEDFGKNPGNLKLYYHLPNGKSEAQNKPLVVVMHGCLQTANEVAELTGWNKLSDLNDFVVLYPQQKMKNNSNLCFNWFLEKDIDKGKGECESIYQMIQYLIKKEGIDPARIFVTGLSAGGAMTMVMAATHPELFQYAAPIAGGAYRIATNAFQSVGVMSGKSDISKSELLTNVKEQNPNYRGKYPKVIVYQGKNDLVVNHKSTKLIIDQWTAVHGTDSEPDSVIHTYKGIHDITKKIYENKSSEPVLFVYEVEDLGHQLLVSPGEEKHQGGKKGIFGVDKSYHSTYELGLEFGIVK